PTRHNLRSVSHDLSTSRHGRHGRRHRSIADRRASLRRTLPHMQVRFVPEGKVTQHGLDEMPGLLRREDGFTWVDIASYDEEADRLLREDIPCHALVREACRIRNHVPSLHGYANHVFVVLHAPMM